MSQLKRKNERKERKIWLDENVSVIQIINFVDLTTMWSLKVSALSLLTIFPKTFPSAESFTHGATVEKNKGHIKQSRQIKQRI